MSRKEGPIRDEAFRKKWSEQHRHCQCCGIPESQAYYMRWPGLSVHHIIRRGRSDEGCNLIKLCQRCHSLAEGLCIIEEGVTLPVLSLGMVLTMKQLREPQEANLPRLQAIRVNPLPDCEAIPECFEDEYNKWKPHHARTSDDW